MKAAGVLYVYGNKVLLLRRGNGGDHPGTWALPGGGIEDGETPEQAARRESVEEIGSAPAGNLTLVADAGGFATFLCLGEQPMPILNHEHTGYVWADIGDYPEPLHPNLAPLLAPDLLKSIVFANRNELDVARAIAAGELTSPQRYANVSLFAVRITGTGTAYRKKLNEYVYRRPENYLTQNFLDRCNGLAVIFEHPEKNLLNSDEFNDRVVGTILLPYIQGDEVWGIAKIYDDSAIELMEKNRLSTSPAVVFHNLEVNSTLTLEDGSTLLIEGKPSLLDHLAICEHGVWDKGGEPSGVISETTGANVMTDAEIKAKADAEAKEKEEAEVKAKADAAGDKLDKVLSCVDALTKRMDSMESNMPGAPTKTAADAEEDEKKAAEAKEKADAEEKAKADAAIKADNAEVARKLADMEARLPKILSDADTLAISDAQARADNVASAFGDSAPRPLQGETPLAYRKRLAGKFKAHSKDYAGIDISAIGDSALFDVVEAKIYADAMSVAMHPVDVPAGQLREIVSTDRSGRRISTFAGDPGTWMGQFKSPKRRLAGINKGA